MRSRPVLVAVLAVLVTACDSPDSQSTYAVRDSAGVRIVETVTEAEILAPWAVPSEPSFRLGWEDEALLIDHLESGVLLTDGRVAVADVGTDSIHIVDRSGEVAESFGGEGQGPGEFIQLTEVVHVGGDTLLAADGGNMRLALYEGTQLLGHVPFLSWIGPVAFGFVGRVAEGFILSPAAYMGPDEADPGWHRWPVLRLDRELETLDTLMMAPDHWHAEPGDDNPMRPTGTVAVAGGHVVIGTTDRPELRWIGADGSVQQIARWTGPTAEVGQAEWALYEQGYRERFEDRMDPAELERRLAAREEDFSGIPPHFGRAFGDRDGRVWLTPYAFTGSASRASSYEIVSADGRYLGRIEFPNEIRLLDVRGDVVVGVEYDEFDVQALAVYELRNRSDPERDD